MTRGDRLTGSSLRVARQRSRAWPILAIALTHLAACNLFASRTAGSFSVTFAWPGGQPPAGLPAPAYAPQPWYENPNPNMK